MLKKTITYTDFNGIQQVEDHYFNLSKAEIVKMDLVERVREGEDSTTGGFAERLQKIGRSGTGKEIIETFEEFLEAAYGRKSDDGRRFMKSPELFKEFRETGAYDALFMELMTDPNATAAFVNAVMPNMNQDSPNVAQQNSAPAPMPQVPAPTPVIPETASPQENYGTAYPQNFGQQQAQNNPNVDGNGFSAPGFPQNGAPAQ